eukprot:scaffold14096_cov78-Cyclotella_meneghiniana.AAC.1
MCEDETTPIAFDKTKNQDRFTGTKQNIAKRAATLSEHPSETKYCNIAKTISENEFNIVTTITKEIRR